MKNKLIFPDSFKCSVHQVVAGAKQWKAVKPNGTIISIVGGGPGLYGDGVNTFEMYDFDEEVPRGYQRIEEINSYLASL
jgi:hypothetical protein